MEKQPTPEDGIIYNPSRGVSLGWFDRPFRNVNIYEPFHQQHPLCSLVSNFLMKRWSYFYAVNDGYLLAGAIFNGGYYGEFFVYLYNRNTQELVEFNGSSLFASDIISAPSSVERSSSYQDDDSTFIITYNGDGSSIILNLSDGETRLMGDLELYNYGDPLVNIRTVSPGRLVYTHQNSLLKVNGNINFSSRGEETHIEFLESSRGGMDFTKGYHLAKTDWYWASACGTYNSPNSIGEVAINFARDIRVTPTSTNHIYAYWVGTQIYRKFEQVVFTRVSDNQWDINSPSIHLTFTQEAVRQKSYHLGPLGYDYIQPVGKYTGLILHEDQWIHVEMFGVFEEHYATW